MEENRKIYTTMFIWCFAIILNLNSCKQIPKIDRFSLVNRHNIENSVIDSLKVLKVGNGEFTFMVDITGLQTFPEYYLKGVTGTISSWNSVAGPDRLNLGIIGLQILKADGTGISMSDIKEPVQKLNLWTGEIESRFNIDGVPVLLKTVCHPDYDIISVKIISDLVKESRLNIKISFPSGVYSPKGFESGFPDKNSTNVVSDSNNLAIINRSVARDNYTVIVWRDDAELKQVDRDVYSMEPGNTDSLYIFSCQFLKDPEAGRIQSFGETEAASKKSWEKFWTEGAVIDFSECTDPRAGKLEEIVVRNQYLTKIQGSRPLPLAGTGMTPSLNLQDIGLPVDLPRNEELLRTVALMCMNDRFPHNGKWKVKWENLDGYVK